MAEMKACRHHKARLFDGTYVDGVILYEGTHCPCCRAEYRGSGDALYGILKELGIFKFTYELAMTMRAYQMTPDVPDAEKASAVCIEELVKAFDKKARTVLDKMDGKEQANV